MERAELGSAKPARPSERLARICGMPDRVGLLRRRRNKHRNGTDYLSALGSVDRAVRVVLHHLLFARPPRQAKPPFASPRSLGLTAKLPRFRGSAHRASRAPAPMRTAGAILIIRHGARRNGTGTIATSPIWRSGCQGVGVDGHVWFGVVVGCGCGLRGGPGVLGFATGVMLIFGGWVPQDLVRRTSAVYWRARRPVGRCSGDESRSCCARAGMLGPPR